MAVSLQRNNKRSHMYVKAEIIRLSPTADTCTCGTGMGPVVIGDTSNELAN